MTNDDREPLISKDENTANAVTEVTEEDLRSAVQKISSLATVVCLYSRGLPSRFIFHHFTTHDLGPEEHGYFSGTHHTFVFLTSTT